MNRREFLVSLLGGGAIITGTGSASGYSGAGDLGKSGGRGSGQSGERAQVVKIVGVGGGGGNMLYNIAQMNEGRSALVAVNTDEKALERINLEGVVQKVHIGRRTTSGRGANSNPEVGRRAAIEDRAALRNELRGAGVVAIVAGMGGGTGSGAAPVVAEVSRELGAFTIGVVTLPFSFEGERRERYARESLLRLQSSADAVVVIGQDKYLDQMDKNARVGEAFKLLDTFVATVTTDLIKVLYVDNPANLDEMNHHARSLLYAGIGESSQATGATLEAMRQAAVCPLIPMDVLKRASFVLMVVTTDKALPRDDIDDAVQGLRSLLPKDASVTFSAKLNPAPTDEVRVTLFVSVGKVEPLRRT